MITENTSFVQSFLEQTKDIFKTTESSTLNDNFSYIRTNQKKVLDISRIDGGRIIHKSSASFNIKPQSTTC